MCVCVCVRVRVYAVVDTDIFTYLSKSGQLFYFCAY